MPRGIPNRLITIVGVEAIDKTFRALPKKIQNDILRKVIREKLRPIMDKAQQIAPYDEGDLRKNIRIRAMRRKRHWVGRSIYVLPKLAATQTGTKKVRRYVAGMFMETGTKHVKARPYMVPARQMLGLSALNAARREIAKRTLKMANRLAKMHQPGQI